MREAHGRLVYLMKTDGSVARLTRDTGVLSGRRWIAPRGFSSTVEPGDIILVPLRPPTDRRTLEAVRDAVDIMYRIAVSLGVLLRL